MSHDIYNNNMAYVAANGTPWHGLGHAIPEGATIDDCLRLAGMTHKIQRRYVRMSVSPDSEKTIIIPGHMAIVRDTDNHVFMVASDRYHPMQYSEMVSLFRDFVEAGDMTMDTLGLLKDGAIAWCMAKIGADFTLAGGDKVVGNLLISTSHDGSLTTEARICTERVVCRNTLTMARGETGACFSIKHSRRDKKAAIKEAREKLKLVKDRFNRFAEWANVLANAKVQDEQHVYQYLQTLTGKELLENAVETQSQMDSGNLLDAIVGNTNPQVIMRPKKLKDEDLTRAGRGILEAIMDSPGSTLPSAKGTWWGVLNGVTHYYDHEAETRIKGDDNRQLAREDNRLTSAWYGTGARIKQEALELALQYVKKAA